VSEEMKQEKQDKRDRWAIRERWSYVVLALIIVFLFLLLGGAGYKYVQDNDHAFCELVIAIHPAKTPALPIDPNSTPALEKQYQTEKKQYDDYQIITRLGHRLGCF
jgi:hypothetical protein